MKVLPLGTNGFFPSFGRQTMCFAIPLGKTLIILDAGSGLFRLAEPTGKKLLAGVDNIHLYLSHYHLDHTFGFYAAWKLFSDKKVTVFGKSDKRVFSELPHTRYFPVDYAKVFHNFSWKTLKEGNHAVDNYLVAVRYQDHVGEGSLAFRFEYGKTSLAYVTDSEPTRESVEFIKGVSFLLHEHYLSGEELLTKKNVKLEDHYVGKHVTTVGAATIAKGAKVGKLALIHHYPFADEKQLKNQLKIAKSIYGKTILAEDCRVIE